MLSLVNLILQRSNMMQKQILVNPISLLASQEIDVVSVGNASIDGTVTNSDLAAFLSTQAGSEIKRC